MRIILIISIHFLAVSCTLDWTAGRFVPGAISSSQRCSKLEAAMGKVSYCSIASAYRSPTISGSGSDSDPYIICSPYELNAIASTAALMDKSFKLGADINMSCISSDHTPIGSLTSGYSGILDGNSKKISNWTRIEAAEDNVGLISYLRKGVVKDLTMENASIQGNNNVGMIVGHVNHGFLLRVHSSGTVSGNTYVGGLVGYAAWSLTQSSSSAAVLANSIAGGLAGGTGHMQIGSSSFSGTVTVTGGTAGGIAGISGGMIANCYNTGNITGGADKIGGIAGSTSYHIHNSFSTGPVSGTVTVGGIVGSMTSATTTLFNSFSTGDVYGNGGTSANVGVLYGTNAGATTNSYYFSGSTCDADTATVGIQACGTNSTGSHATVSDFYSSANPPLSSWDFQNNSGDGTNNFWEERATAFPVAWYENPEAFTPPFSGAGTETSPYLITTEAEFNSIGMNPRLLESHFRLDANLDFTGGFTQLSSEEAPFYGSFDGNGNTLSNITHTKTTAFSGVFGMVAKSAITDLTVTGVSITGGVFSGGLVGYTLGTVTQARSTGSLTGSYHVGGLVGLSAGSVTSSSSAVAVAGPGSALGGLVGNNYGTIIKSYSTGNVTNGTSHIGGLAGTSSGSLIEDSYATGNVSTGGVWISNYGGLVGYFSGGTIRRSYATGNVTAANNSYAGGFVGNNVAGAEIVNCFSTGNVAGNGGATRTGPLVGNSLLTITNSYSLATSTCDSGSAGGIQACNVLGTGTIPLLTDFHDTNTSPIDQWDFTDVWNSDGASLPLLQ